MSTLSNTYWLLGLMGILLVVIAALISPSLRRHLPYAWLIRPALMALQGRKFYCSLTDIYRGYPKSLVFPTRYAEVSQRCTLLERNSTIECWDTPAGAFWVPCESGKSHLAYLLAEQESRTYGDNGDEVHFGDVVFDCGANVGVFTREALRLGASLVVAFEPAPKTAECFRRNLESEIRAGKVIIYAKGLWSEDSKMKLSISANCGLNSLTCEVADPIGAFDVDLTTIDHVVTEIGIDKVDFVKMDVEGSELEALRGAATTLLQSAPRIAIEVDHTSDPVSNACRVIDFVRSVKASYAIRSDLWIVLRERGVYPGVLLFRAA